MSVTADDDHSKDDSVVKRCSNLNTWLEQGRITFEEYASNITFAIVRGSIACVERCAADLIPGSVLENYVDYLRNNVEIVDFMPCPGPFLVAPTPEKIDRAKQQLRPKYLRLFQTLTRRQTQR